MCCQTREAWASRLDPVAAQSENGAEWPFWGAYGRAFACVECEKPAQREEGEGDRETLRKYRANPKNSADLPGLLPIDPLLRCVGPGWSCDLGFLAFSVKWAELTKCIDHQEHPALGLWEFGK